MTKKLIALVVALIGFSFFALYFVKNQNKEEISQVYENERSYTSNIIENVKYSSRDINGNQYVINAEKGEIDIKDGNIIFLTNVAAIIKLKNSKNILISSNFGKYNITNFDTIFSENVIINYLQNEVKGEYLDFSIQRNSMIISKNVIFSDNVNVLKTDVIEINIKTKDTRFFMYDKNNKVSLMNKN